MNKCSILVLASSDEKELIKTQLGIALHLKPEEITVDFEIEKELYKAVNTYLLWGEKEISRICAFFRNQKVDYLFVNVYHRPLSSLLNDTESEELWKKLFRSFMEGNENSTGKSVIIYSNIVISDKFRAQFEKICIQLNLSYYYIHDIEEISAALGKSVSMTIFVEKNHLHCFEHKYNTPPATGKFFYCIDRNELLQCITSFDSITDNTVRKRTGMEKAGNLMDFLNRHSPALNNHILNKNIPYFSSFYIFHEEPPDYYLLPFEFISRDNYWWNTWTLNYKIIHQLPHHLPPSLHINKRTLKILLLESCFPDRDIIVNFPESRHILFRKLPYAAREITEIKKYFETEQLKSKVSTKTYDKTEIRRGISIEEARLVKTPRLALEEITGIMNEGFDIIHYTGHCHMEKNRLYFHLPVKGDKKHCINLDQFQEMIAPARPALLYLSTCNAGKSSALLELARSVSFIIAHRWELSDKQGCEFARFFYEQILYGFSPPDALLSAKRKYSQKPVAFSARMVCGAEQK